MKRKILDLTYQDRYDWWIIHNYETGIEYNPDSIPDFDDEYWIPTPIKVVITEDENGEIKKEYLTKKEWREYQLNNLI
jgi:hypothetical protein